MTGKAQVNGVELWYEITGEGEPVIQIHGAGFGHFNFAPATPGDRRALPRDRLRHARLRAVRPAGAALRHGGVGRRRRRPARRARDRRGARPRHVDGRDDRDRLRRQVPGAHDVGRDQLRRGEARRRGPAVFKNWIDIARLDPDGPGSRILAELIAWQALSKSFLETPDGVAPSTRSSRSCATRTASRSSRPPARRCATWT